jgi:glycosyltransferase involved in cell wall biosynthesis
MNKTPLVSIIIPTYNSEIYISEAIESSINQTYDNIEIIVVDDGSTDESYKILEKYIQNHENFKLYSQKNKGACAARNLGIIKSNGEYIQFLDSDDILKLDKIEKQMSYVSDLKTILFCNTINFYGNDITNIISKTIKPNRLNIFDLIRNHYVFTPTVLIPRAVFSQFGMFNEKLKRAQEHEFNLRLAANGYEYINLKFEGVYVRHHNSETRISNQNIMGSEDNDLLMLNLVKNHIVSFCINIKDEKDRLLSELIYLSIYKAQQHGNIANFRGVRLIDNFINSILTEIDNKFSYNYKSSKFYNFLLRVLGISKFEILRFYFQNKKH